MTTGAWTTWSSAPRGIGIEGRSKMDKAELVDALRNH